MHLRLQTFQHGEVVLYAAKMDYVNQKKQKRMSLACSPYFSNVREAAEELCVVARPLLGHRHKRCRTLLSALKSKHEVVLSK